MPQDSPSRRLDQFNIRLPPRLRPKLAKLAKSNHRSMNAEIVFHLVKAIEAHTKAAPESAPTLPRA